MHPDLPTGEAVDAVGEFVERDVERPVDVAVVVLIALAHIENGEVLLAECLAEVGEVCDAVGPQFGAGDEGVNFPDCVAGEGVDADADELASGLRDLFFGVADQGQGCSPSVEPAEVGHERIRQLETECAAEVAGREGGALAQVDDPLAGLDALS